MLWVNVHYFNPMFIIFFWVLMLLWALYGFWARTNPERTVGHVAFLFVLIFLLGWKVYPFHA